MDNFENQYKRKNPFSVPEEYFENLTDRVMEKVEKKTKPQKPHFLQIIKPYIGLVAIFALALFVVQIILPGIVDKSQMLKKENGQIVQQVQTLEQSIDLVPLDSHFEATSDEIIEYLASEVNTYDLIYAGIY